MMLDQIRRSDIPDANVLELGIGPTYMVRSILAHDSLVHYEGLNLSEAFFEVARNALGPLSECA